VTLSPAWLDELRARTLLSAVISPSVKLIRAGREWKACCPFHNEKTPSFTVNDDKGFYHCFGCGAHGDAIRFLTDHRGLPFMDAVKELAAKAGMDVPASDPRARERAERTASLTEVMAAVQKWFADQLQGIQGAAAREYLRKRGIDSAQIARFGLGLAPDNRNALKRALAHLGEDRLVETGMLIKPEEEGKETYDRFRGRLMFPIRDARGRVIAFGGRILGDGEPKYLNSPDTPLFDKGRTLYNIDRAGPASRQAKRLIVVEGYMDVIALDRAGIVEAVAPNGTAVTEAQLERMWRLDPAPILCFDGDSAGRKAAIRAATRALPLLGPERSLRFAELPPGQDPDDLVRSGGKEAMEALLAEPEPLDQRLWRHERDLAPLTTPEARAIFAPSGHALREGELFCSPELGDTIERLGADGAAPFYTGDIAETVVAFLQERGGALTGEDLAGYAAVEREPVRVAYRGREVLTNPPPNAGGVLLALALGLLDREPAAPSIEAVVRTMEEVQAERTTKFVEGLDTPGFGTAFLADRLGSTTHISVVDAGGLACSVTCTNGEGSGIVVPGTGIHVNNIMGEEDLSPLGFHTAPAGRRMPSMMAPTAMLGATGELELVLGSAGSNRIRSAILQAIVGVVDHGLPIAEAVEAPRVHFEAGTVYAEPGVPVERLSGHEVVRFREANLFFGGVQAVARDPATGALRGAGDPRRGGAVAVA